MTLKPRTGGRGRLGCGVNEAHIAWKCDGANFCPAFDTSEITYSRSLSEISEATVVIPLLGTDEACCECLGEIEPWCHELHITRDGKNVWLGPITEVIYEFSKVTIKAFDLLGWATVRIAECAINFTDDPDPGGQDCAIIPRGQADLTTIGRTILDYAFAEDDPCILDYVSATDAGIVGARLFPAYTDSAFDQLDALADTGLTYTVIGRTVILAGAHPPAAPIATLMDDHIIGDVKLTKTGLQQANLWYVHYADDDTDIPPGPGFAAAPDRFCYGLIERMQSNTEIPTKENAEQAAQDLLDATYAATAPRLLEIPEGSRLSPEAPWPFEAMIPGVRVDVGITRLCVPATQPFLLTGVTVHQTQAGEEITVGLGPFNTIAGGL